MKQIGLFSPGDNGPVTVLAFGAHPDDIEYGCGGSLAWLRSVLGKQLRLVYVLFSSGYPNYPERKEEAKHAADMLGADRVDIFDYPDTLMPEHWSEIKDVMRQYVKSEDKIDVVLTHNRNDLHQDHKTIALNTLQVFRDHLILEYEIPKYEGDLSTPNVYIPLADEFIERKVEILMKCYKSQQQGAQAHHWFSRDLFLSLARIRGVEANCKFAEGFHGRKLLGGAL
jgi:LmbE family N-acetylglucosaminyl deacetylase